ncbi:MAG: RnfABCDGE type electron transport complex subunit D [Pseudomonadales bacterium]|jgi:electron transport complex protein RnfD|nr:RnfABCDGE type electron transport complex subunit D [Pseudomonadales bacterium]MCP5321819.1 RnfABCDGE type electron transport complex subunit D [Pseudomonadales bacterium]
MALPRPSSPHLHGTASTARTMRDVLFACIPGLIALTVCFGWGTLVNLLWSVPVALACEAAMLHTRGLPIRPALADSSALVTAVLLGLALPPAAPWWLVALGTAMAVMVAKHLYGGLGQNPFNPAMIGYVVLLISFPVEMTRWMAPLGASDAAAPGPVEALRAALGVLEPARLDALTMATPLDLLHQNHTLLIAELWRDNPQFGHFGGTGWEWVNAGFLLGGVYLLWRRVFTWHAPLGMLGAIVLMAALFHDGGSAASGGSPLFHLFTGATMLGAFFIVTDPVTAPVSTRGRLLGGALVGVLVYLIRHWGNYPDAVAFSVLLMNFAAPMIDHLMQPRAYGHGGGDTTA